MEDEQVHRKQWVRRKRIPAESVFGSELRGASCAGSTGRRKEWEAELEVVPVRAVGLGFPDSA